MYTRHGTIQMLAAVLISAFAVTASATSSHSKRSYVKKNGTYVAPSRATNPNNTKRDNYSHNGNVNPANGKAGKKK